MTVPVAAAPAVPLVPGLPAPAPAPALPAVNGQPITLGSQVPGLVPNLGQQPPAAAPAAPTQAAPVTAADLQAFILQTLGQAAPAAPAAVAPAADRPAWMDASANSFDLNQIDDPVIRSMASMLQTSGKDLNLDRVLGKALTYGDASLIDVAYLNEKAGANAPHLAGVAKGIVDAVAARSAAITAEVHTLAGGEAQWGTAVAAFNAAAPSELKLVVAQMLNSTKADLIKAGAKLVAGFSNSSGRVPQGGANPATVAAGGNQGLSRVQFTQELAKLNPETPGFEQAREALFVRRHLGKRAGM